MTDLTRSQPKNLIDQLLADQGYEPGSPDEFYIAPSADRWTQDYVADKRFIQRELSRISDNLSQRKRRMLEALKRSSTYTQAAKQLKCSPQTLSRFTRDKKIAEYFHYYQRLLELERPAASTVRNRMLWGIATTNADSDPAVAIASIKEINKQELNNNLLDLKRQSFDLDKLQANRSSPTASVTIIVSDAALKPTVLDIDVSEHHTPNHTPNPNHSQPQITSNPQIDNGPL